MTRYIEGLKVEVECVIVGVTIATMGPSSIRLATERYTQTHEVSFGLALKAMCLDARSVRASFLSIDGKLIDIESADVPAFDAARGHLAKR